MKFYLLFIFFSFLGATAQKPANLKTSNLTQKEIDKKLDSITKSSKQRQKQNLSEIDLLIALKKRSEEINYDDGILTSGSYLMSAYDNLNKNKEITGLGDELKKTIAKYKEDPTGIISSILRRNAVALGYLGLDDESRKDLNLALKYSESIKNSDARYFQQGSIYENITMAFSNMPNNDKKNRDSIVYFLNKSLEATKKIKDANKKYHNLKPESIGFTYVRLGIFYLEQASVKGSLEKAEEYLLESYKIYENKNYKLSSYNKTVMLNQMSWLYMEKKEYEKSIEFANKALELEKKFKNPTNRVESFEFLATCYPAIGEKEKAKLYMSKYTVLKDSLNMSLRNDTNAVLKKIVKSTDSKYEEKSRKQLIAAGALILIAGSAAIILWRRNNKKLRKSYELMIEKLKNETGSQKIESTTTNRNVISSDTEKRILDQLEIFESSEEFLKHNLTISLLSTQLSTNSKYLSEIIKNYKSHSFSNYINHLRINYIVHKLYNEPKYRGYKTSHLAEICGYASPQVFFAAFKKINGVTPVYFIQKLNEDEKTI